MLSLLVALPIAYLATIIVLARRGRARELAISAMFVVTTLAVGLWSIAQSPSSTAGLGVLFLPALAAVAGLLAIPIGATRRSQNARMRGLGIAGLGLAAAPIALLLMDGRRVASREARQDAEQGARDANVARYRAEVAAMTAGPGPQSVDRSIRERRQDREYLIAALESPAVSPELLDTLAQSSDPAVSLQAVRNPNARAETLTWAYRSSARPMYYFQALAAHPNTPPEILRSIAHTRPAPISGLGIWLAGNSATPRDLLAELARESDDVQVLRVLLRHPSLDCGLVRLIEAGPALSARTADEETLALAREQRGKLCG